MGFTGWPTALHLSDAGHDIVIIDDLSRQTIMERLGVQSLVPTASVDARLAAWKAVTGKTLAFRQLDLSKDVGEIQPILKDCDAVVHLAEQSSAPYSMRGPVQRRYTVTRNVSATHNLLTMVSPETPIVHLGTMGVYGYGGSTRPLPEGWVMFHGKRVLHPFTPGSVYHATKCLDATLLETYCRLDGYRVTDLHQGIVWGTQTDQTAKHPDLANPFWWDGDYGTVLNRFLMQGATGRPITVHGTGGQVRAFIHIRDTVRCIQLAVEHPPKAGEYRVFNQAAEVHKVVDLATMVAAKTNGTVEHIRNPRKEAAQNDLSVAPWGLRRLGWKPTLLETGLMDDILTLATAGQDRIRDEAVASVRWR